MRLPTSGQCFIPPAVSHAGNASPTAATACPFFRSLSSLASMRACHRSMFRRRARSTRVFVTVLGKSPARAIRACRRPRRYHTPVLFRISSPNSPGSGKCGGAALGAGHPLTRGDPSGGGLEGEGAQHPHLHCLPGPHSQLAILRPLGVVQWPSHLHLGWRCGPAGAAAPPRPCRQPRRPGRKFAAAPQPLACRRHAGRDQAGDALDARRTGGARRGPLGPPGCAPLRRIRLRIELEGSIPCLPPQAS